MKFIKKRYAVKKRNPYIHSEKKVMDALVKAVNAFSELERTHPSHNRDFVDGIHKCQNIIIHRIAQRDYPKIFPTNCRGD